jgi:hypothetical protein
MNDNVNHPKHYTEHPSGVECIQITEHMNFCMGNAMKYLWRADLKGGVEDLQKAIWYLEREIRRRENEIRRTSKKASVVTTISGVHPEPSSLQGWQLKDSGKS